MFHTTNTLPIVIGFHSRVGGGKDTAAKGLSQLMRDTFDGSFTQAAYADPGRHYLCEILGIYGITMEHFTDTVLKDTIFEPLGKTPRDLLKDYLSGWGREMVKDSIWVDTMNAKVDQFIELNADHTYKVHGPNIMAVTDVRKPNEAQGLLDSGGIVVEIRNCHAESRTDTGDARYGTEDGLNPDLIDYTIANNFNPKTDDPEVGFARLTATLKALLDEIFAARTV